MHKEHIIGETFRFVILKLIWDFLYFPIWWYSIGLKERFLVFLRQMKDVERSLALKIWIKNMFVPMYGFYDIWSRIISFFMRVVMLAYKTVAFFFWLVFYFALFLIYILLPVFAVYMFFRSMLILDSF
ncbi:MAG: hypothetical protein ABIF17_01840 [Patescibacteria group bacterium]